MIRIEDIIQKYKDAKGLSDDPVLIRKAYVFAAKILQGRKPKGQSYMLQQSLEIASILVDMAIDMPCVASGLLYEAVAETQVTIDEVKEVMGDEIATIVDGLVKIRHITMTTSFEEKIAENMRQMIFASSKDIRVIFIKLADRLAFLRHLENFTDEESRQSCRETLSIYAPIAHRLGLSQIKTELEEHSFVFLYPEESKKIDAYLEENKAKIEAFSNRIIHEIKDLLVPYHIEGEISSRVKHNYSIYKKTTNNVGFGRIFDLIAARVIVKNKEDCYKTLGIIHENYQPVEGRFKDYISMPKSNGYQSLHTTVANQDGVVFEVQIRTIEMNMVADMGIAAHWAYKEGSNRAEQEKENIAWVRELTQHLNIVQDFKESLEVFSREFYPDSVYVFSPQGKIYKLPKGSCVIDFAYAVHTDIGNRCTGAKIGDRMVPIRTILNHGDQVEIITSVNQSPKSDWLKYVASSKALSKIRYELRLKEQVEAEKVGEEIFNRVAKKINLKTDTLSNLEEFKQYIQHKGYSTQDEYLRALGYGKVDSEDLQNILEKQNSKKTTIRQKISRALTPKRKEEGVRIAGMRNVLVRYANCCSPVRGDKVVGIITKGKGVSIHLQECENVRHTVVSPERLLDVEWIDEQYDKLPVTIHIEQKSDIKVSLAVLKVLSVAEVNLLESNFQTIEGKAFQKMKIEVSDSSQLEQILKKLNNLSSVKAYRKREHNQTEPL